MIKFPSRYNNALLTCGSHHALAASPREFVATHPYRERARGQLMVALYRAGRQSDALAVYHAGREQLRRELGLDPSPPLRALYERILRQDPAVLEEPVFALT